MAKTENRKPNKRTTAYTWPSGVSGRRIGVLFLCN